MPLRIYILTLSAIALAAFIYRTLLGSFFVRRYIYTITAVRQLNSKVIEITMKPNGAKLDFRPGQFIFVRFKHRTPGPEVHPFSITSAPDQNQLTIAIKKLGDYTARLAGLPVNTLAEIEGPFGAFSYQNAQCADQIWIAGGIGITPFISMAQALPADGEYTVNLYYCVKNKNELVYGDLLKTKESAYFRVVPFFSDQQGRIGAERIIGMAAGIKRKEIFICAPPPMIRSLTKQFIAQGVAKKLIHAEEFNF